MPARHLPPLLAGRAFEAAARHLSITRAAEELNVTPGAVGRHVRALERQLDSSLFIRRSTGLELTAVGDALAVATRDALDRLAEATSGARLHRRRRLSIGAYGFFVSRLLLPIWPALRRAHPDIAVDIHSSSNPLDLLPSRYDAVIAVSDTPLRSGLVVRPLVPIATVPVCAPMILASGPLDFAETPLLHARPRPDDWRRWLDHAGFASIPVHGGSSFESLSLMLEATAAGLGAAIAIEALLGPDLARGDVAVAHPSRRPTRRHFVLCYEMRLAKDPSLAAFADWLCDQFVGA